MNTPGGENENRLKLHMMESTHRDLNSFRVQNIMLLCSLYDYYTVEEDGMLEDMLPVPESARREGSPPSTRCPKEAPP